MEAAVTLSIFRLEESFIFSLVCPAKSHLSGQETLHTPTSVGGETRFDATLRSQLNQALSTAVEQLQRRYLPRRRATLASLGTTLKSLGQFLFSYLLPPVLQDALHRLPDEIPILIQTNDTLLPWELLHDGSEYLALLHPMGRLLWTSQPIRSASTPSESLPEGFRSFLFIANPTQDLDEADVETEQLLELFDSEFASGVTPVFVARAHATKWKLLQVLGTPHELIHYSGHTKPGALLLADGELTTEEIRKAIKGSPFVFLNGCWSVREQAASNENEFANALILSDLAEAFMTGGACGFVGTLWPVFDHSSRHFAEQFYTHVRRGESVGEALRQARRQMREAHPDDPIWASFVLVGDPRLKISTPPPHETRSVTVLVAHIETVFESHHFEAAVEMLEAAKRLLKGIAERYGGLVEIPYSDTVKVYFGLPKAHGNDAEHACYAAFDMIRALPPQSWRDSGLRGGEELRLRIGISSGRVMSLGEHQTSGDVEGRARQLATFAEAGQILVDKATTRLARSRLTFARLAPSQLPETYSVVGTRRGTKRANVLFGRQKELAQLHQWWHEVAQSGEGRLVGIIGAPGVGKTRLVTAFREQITEVHSWISTVCYAYNKSQSVGLLAQVIKALAGLKADDDEIIQRDKLSELIRAALPRASSGKHFDESMANLSRVIGLPYPYPELDNLPASLRQKKLVRLIYGLLSNRQRPLVLVLEDLQWADEASFAIFNQIVTRLGRLPILLLATYRPTWSHNWGSSIPYRHLPLDDLSQNASQSLLAHLLGKPSVEASADRFRKGGGRGSIEEKVSQLILSQTGGNPFFIEEYLWLLQENGYLVRAGESFRLSPSPLPLPSSVERVIQARLDQLPAESRALIQTAAVIGEKFEDELLQAVLEKDKRLRGNREELRDIRSGLPLLVMRNLIYEVEGWPYFFYTFSHGLVHDIVYRLLPEGFRRPVHRQVAQALAQLYDDEEEILPRLAHHYYHSYDRVNAIRYGLLTAKQAAKEWANQTALEWYGRVQELLQKLRSNSLNPAEEAVVPPSQMIDWQVEALEGQADVQKTIGRAEEAIQGYTQALELMTKDASITHRADLYHKLATAHHDKGQFDAAQEALNKGLDVLSGQVCLEAGRLHIYTGLIHYRRGRLLAGLASCEEAITIISKSSSIRDLAQAYNLQGLISHHYGESEKALKAYKQSIALYEQAQDLPGQERAFFNLATMYKDLGQWNAARLSLEKSRALSDRTGETRRQAGVLNTLGEIYRRQGSLCQAILVYEEAQQLLEELGSLEFVGIALMNQGATYLKEGTESKARACLEESLSLFQRLNANVHLPEVLRYLAELELLSGNLTEALRLAQNALNLVSQQKHKLEEGQAKRVLGQVYRELGQLSEAKTQLEESLTILSERNNPYELGLTLVELTRLRSREGDEGDEQQTAAYRKRASAIFEELGAALDLKRAQQI